jgi:hypothetical protein
VASAAAHGFLRQGYAVAIQHEHEPPKSHHRRMGFFRRVSRSRRHPGAAMCYDVQRASKLARGVFVSATS